MMAVDPGDFTPEALAAIAPDCGECGPMGRVALVKGADIYPSRRELWVEVDGADKHWWKCRCGAYTRCARGTLRSLGTPAGAETRQARIAAHGAFDPLWQKRQRLDGITAKAAKAKGYKWLAAQLGIDPKDCHIAMMDARMARRVVDVCKRR